MHPSTGSDVSREHNTQLKEKHKAMAQLSIDLGADGIAVGRSTLRGACTLGDDTGHGDPPSFILEVGTDPQPAFRARLQVEEPESGDTLTVDWDQQRGTAVIERHTTQTVDF